MGMRRASEVSEWKREKKERRFSGDPIGEWSV